MVTIPEYKRDESADERLVISGLKEIPFPVGKNLLVDFLYGENDNKSVEKNNLFDFPAFGSMRHLEKGRIGNVIEKLIAEGKISSSPSVFNNGSKVLSVTKNKEVAKNPENNIQSEANSITDTDMKAFKELDSFLSDLNTEQKKAVVSPREKILCIAGAGSGKTRVLTKRIEFLVKMKRVKPEKILAITFTRKAKEEMEKRLRDSGTGAIVETFNSFCEKFLLRNTAKVYGRKMKVADFRDKMVAVLRALDDQKLELPDVVRDYFKGNGKNGKNLYELQNLFVSDCFDIFDKMKLSGLNAGELERKYFHDKNDSAERNMINIIKYLERYFQFSGLRTYADQVNDTVNYLKVYPKAIPKFEHILVDEFQDINEEQAELLKILDPKNLFCVGDPRQSIFGWRGSKIEHILNFKKEYPDSQIISLSENYRSAKNIIDFMNISVKNFRFPDLRTSIDEEGAIELGGFGSEEDEYNFVIDKILSMDIPRKEIFVLSRTNKEVNNLSDALKKAGIKHIVKSEGKKEIEAKGDEVTLSTVHSIKGLEAQSVFLVGCTVNNFPSRYSEHPLIEKINPYDYNKNDEEKRLFYVAISRAKKNLFLTYSGKVHTYFITDEMKKIIGIGTHKSL